VSIRKIDLAWHSERDAEWYYEKEYRVTLLIPEPTGDGRPGARRARFFVNGKEEFLELLNAQPKGTIPVDVLLIHDGE